MIAAVLAVCIAAPAPVYKETPLGPGTYNATWNTAGYVMELRKDGTLKHSYSGQEYNGTWKYDKGTLYINEFSSRVTFAWSAKLNGEEPVQATGTVYMLGDTPVAINGVLVTLRRAKR